MLPDRVIPARIVDGRIVPTFLGPQDYPWLGVLIDEIGRFSGRPRRELDERLRAPLPCAAPFAKQRVATAVFARLWRTVAEAPVRPAAAREALFTESATRIGWTRAAVVSSAAEKMSITPGALETALFADLPGERVVTSPPSIPDVADAACRVNLAIAQNLLQRATIVRVSAEGAMRPVIRRAHLRGLICTVALGLPTTLEISGPFALFRRTLLYGRALSELLPFLARTARFELTARCTLRGRDGVLVLRSGDPIAPRETARPFDSKVEERFARDFKKLACDWDVVREPAPVRAGDRLIFPDFLLWRARRSRDAVAT